MFKKIFITGIFAALMLSSITANAMEKKDINNKSNTLVNNNNNKNNDNKIDLFSILYEQIKKKKLQQAKQMKR